MQLKKCKCKHCQNYSMKVIECKTRLMSVSYIAKEIAKVQDRYEEHDLGRIWGTSQNMRNLPVSTMLLSENLWNKIIDEKLKENFRSTTTQEYVASLKDTTVPRTIFIDYKKIEELIHKSQVDLLPQIIKYKRYNLKRGHYEHSIRFVQREQKEKDESDIF
jgi:hypothetical protein